MIQKIEKNNTLIKNLNKLRVDSKFRNEQSLFYIEGLKILLDTPFDLIHELYICEDVFDDFIKKCPIYNKKNIYVLSNNIYDKVKDTTNSQGYIATVRYNIIDEINENDINKMKRCIVLDNVNDPGNLGTIIRLAEASNIDLIILANHCCNIYNPKVIRASMSSIFRTKILVADNVTNIIDILRRSEFNILSTSLSDNSKLYTDINYRNKTVLIFGNEANGVSEGLLNISDDLVKIPMGGEIESLNVAISAAIICYEIVRQNN